MAENQEDKTETATPKRREDARRKGDVAQSRDLVSVFVLGVAMLLAVSGPAHRLVQRIAEHAGLAWGGSLVRPQTLADVHAILLDSAWDTALAAVPLVVVILVAAIAGPLVQTGPMISAEALGFRWNRLDPVQGFKRLLSPDKLFDLAKSLIKLAVVAGVVYLVLAPETDRLFQLAYADLRQEISLLGELTIRFGASVVAALGALALLDVAWVRWRHEQKLRMTRREVRDELRQREGSPEVRGRMRALQRDTSRLRMIAEVADADVVVRNPTHYAVALRYERSTMNAPQVIAKGRNKVALRILDVARENDVPVVENPGVARLLFRTTRVGRPVPEALYDAVAEILAYVYRLDRQRGDGWMRA